MKDADCVQFLHWALPRLHLRWQGFRRVHRQVCKRLGRRLQELRLTEVSAYRCYLATHPSEWSVLDSLCRITLSRFYRDRAVFTVLAEAVLPELARRALSQGTVRLRAWSIGCACGEEPYSLALLWQWRLRACFSGLTLEILATDTDPALLERAKQSCYPDTSLTELPMEWRAQAFQRIGKLYCLNPRYRENLVFEHHDVRRPPPPGPFHLILCRNVVLTYFDADLQRAVLASLQKVLWPGGALVIGLQESLPPGVKGFTAWSEQGGIYRHLPVSVDR